MLVKTSGDNNGNENNNCVYSQEVALATKVFWSALDPLINEIAVTSRKKTRGGKKVGGKGKVEFYPVSSQRLVKSSKVY
jgi:hypothetical protein